MSSFVFLLVPKKNRWRPFRDGNVSSNNIAYIYIYIYIIFNILALKLVLGTDKAYLWLLANHVY